MLEQVSSGLFLAARAVVESVRLLKMPWNDFTSDSVCGGICAPAVCLQAGWLCWHVFPEICHLCLPPGMAVTGVLSVSDGRGWGRGRWQQQPPHWQLGKRWGGRGDLGLCQCRVLPLPPRPVQPPCCCRPPCQLPVPQPFPWGCSASPWFKWVSLLLSFILLLGVAFSPKLIG